MKKENPYYIFLEGLLKDLRITANGFQEKYSLRSFSTIMNKLKNEPEKTLHPETIGKIETALNIKIDDSNPEEITYRKLGPEYVPIHEAEKNHVPNSLSFPILGEIPAGIAEIKQYNDFFEYFDFDLDPRKHGVLRIDNEFGYSMMPLVGPGDLAIISFDDKPRDGDWVAARWDETKGALKVLAIDKNNPEIVVLNSYNTAVQPIILNSKKQKLTLWKVPVVIRASKRR
jgi:SOS-response transcriptional repressor LexA